MSGYFQDPANADARVCLQCPTNCQTCTSTSVCTVCLSSYSLTTASQCSNVCGPSCDLCNTVTSVCTTCSSGYSLNISNLCQCNARTYAVSFTNFTCLSCHSSCLTCTGPLNTDCLSCDATNDFRVLKTVSGNPKC